MPNEVSSTGLRMLHLVEVNLRADGITAEVEQGSLCLFRPVYDKPSATAYGMTSVIANLARGPTFARFYCIEQSDSTGALAKFIYRLTDANKQTLYEWHKDVSHRVHTHLIIDGKKDSKHIPYSGNDQDLLRDILAAIRRLQSAI